MKPILLNIFSETPQTEAYLESCDNLGDSVKQILVKLPFYPGHLHRWDYVPDVCEDNDMVIFTDTDDVRWQTPIKLPEADIVLGPENCTHTNGYWEHMIKELGKFKSLLDKPVYNVGCFAMKYKILKEFIIYLQEMRNGMPELPQQAEQLIFNMFVQQYGSSGKKKIVEDYTIFCPLYNNMEAKGVHKEPDGLWYDEYNNTIVCCHFNGSFKRFM